MKEVTVEQFVTKLGDEDRRQVQEALKNGMGMARYGPVNVSYGTREAVIVTRFAPARFGDHELGDFVSPIPTPASMRSPLMDAIGGPPQIKAPPRGQTRTSYPSVEFETRVSRNPRGKSDGYIEVQRLRASEQRQEEAATEVVTEEVAWWARHL
jgi:hypothetical protein